MAKKSISEISAEIEAKIERIEERKAQLLKQKENREKELIAKEVKAEAEKQEKFRKYTTHMKVVIGGYILAKARRDKTVFTVKEILGTLKNAREKDWLSKFINGIDVPQRPAPKPPANSVPK
jgi:hypothetical protein